MNRPIDYDKLYNAIKSSPIVQEAMKVKLNYFVEFENLVETQALKGFLYYHRIVQECPADIWDFVLEDMIETSDGHKSVGIYCNVCDTSRPIYARQRIDDTTSLNYQYLILFDKDNFTWHLPGGEIHY